MKLPRTLKDALAHLESIKYFGHRVPEKPIVIAIRKLYPTRRKYKTWQ